MLSTSTLEQKQESTLELPSEGIPTIVISNHVFSGKLLPSIFKERKLRKDINVVCNAGFAAPLEMLGLQTIPVDSIKHKDDSQILRSAWARLVRASSVIYQKFAQLNTGKNFVNEALQKLENGELIWIAPAGKRESNEGNTRWKPGVGYILYKCLEAGINPTISLYKISDMAIGKNFKMFTLSELVDQISQNSENTVTPLQIIKALHDLFWGK